MASVIRQDLEDGLFPSRHVFDMSIPRIPEMATTDGEINDALLVAMRDRHTALIASDSRTPDQKALGHHADKITALLLRVGKLEQEVQQLRAAQAVQGAVIARQGGRE